MKLKELKDKFILNSAFYCVDVRPESTANIIGLFEEENETLFNLEINKSPASQKNMTDKIADAITSFAMSYNQQKDVMVKVMQGFIKFLKDAAGLSVGLAFQDVDISNTFDRMLYEIRRLNDGASALEISRELFVSLRTVQRDLNKLSNSTDTPISINGRKFVVDNYPDNRNGHIKKTSVNPLFLTENITQIIVLLRGLYKMSEMREYNAYATFTAVEIASQLTKYAKERIIESCKDLLAVPFREKEWIIRILNKERKHEFVSETECSKYGGSCVQEMVKNAIPLTVVTVDGLVYKEVKIRFSNESNCLDLINSDTREIIATVKEKDIIKCTLDGNTEIIL